jgi:acyl-CoA thioesterase-1
MLLLRAFIVVAVMLTLLLAAPARAEPAVILVFGDSLSAGYGLPQGAGWVDLLQRRLTDRSLDYRVVNASISGETTLGGRNRLAGALREHRPKVVILALGANDGLRGQSIDAMRENLNAMVRASRATGAKVLLVGMRIPPNYGSQYSQKFRAVYSDVAAGMKIPLVPFLLEGFADRRELFQADGIHPTAQAQPLMLDTVWHGLEPLLAPAARKAKAR